VVTTPQGNRVVVGVHGGGIFASPQRFERSYYADLDRSNPEGLTGQYAAKISEQEARGVLEGKLPDGAVIPVFPFDEFKRGVADLPMRYGVILDFEMAKKSKRGYETFDALRDELNMIVRAGGVEPLAAYLDKARDRHNTKLMENWHPYNRIDPDQPQTRIVFLAGNKGGVGSEGDDDGLGWGYDAEYGMGGDASMVNMGRYVAVAREMWRRVCDIWTLRFERRERNTEGTGSRKQSNARQTKPLHLGCFRMPGIKRLPARIRLRHLGKQSFCRAISPNPCLTRYSGRSGDVRL
jgi:hypothetical protein